MPPLVPVDEMGGIQSHFGLRLTSSAGYSESALLSVQGSLICSGLSYLLSALLSLISLSAQGHAVNVCRGDAKCFWWLRK